MPSRALLAAAALAAAVSGIEAAGDLPSGEFKTFVSIPPQQYLVDRIGAPYVTTGVLVAPGRSPHSFDLTPRQMVALVESRAYFTIGLPFEREIIERIETLSPQLTIVDVGRGVPRRNLAEYDSEGGSGRLEAGTSTHEHGAPAGPLDRRDHQDHAEEEPGGTDPHIWLAPALLKLEARNVFEALTELDPGHAAEYGANLAELVDELDALDAEIAEALAPIRGRTIYVFHPAFGYFADAYGLEQVAVETGGSEPGPRDLATLVERAKKDGVRVIFVQPQFASSSAKAVAREIGGAVVPIDPLAYDCLNNLRTVASRIHEALLPGNHGEPDGREDSGAGRPR